MDGKVGVAGWSRWSRYRELNKCVRRSDVIFSDLAVLGFGGTSTSRDFYAVTFLRALCTAFYGNIWGNTFYQLQHKTTTNIEKFDLVVLVSTPPTDSESLSKGKQAPCFPPYCSQKAISDLPSVLVLFKRTGR